MHCRAASLGFLNIEVVGNLTCFFTSCMKDMPNFLVHGVDKGITWSACSTIGMMRYDDNVDILYPRGGLEEDNDFFASGILLGIPFAEGCLGSPHAWF